MCHRLAVVKEQLNKYFRDFMVLISDMLALIDLSYIYKSSLGS